ncbi:MAG: IclR family transcriptional regulator [Actinomycetales bacterium]|nr:IclR family transcriptional regulator [Actinomycetales bacterium]
MPRPTEQDTPRRGAPPEVDARSALGKALAILDAFSAAEPDLSIRDIAERSGVARSTTHRLVGELVAWGALERGPRGVRPGPRLFELGSMAPTPRVLREAASPYLHTLREASRLTVNLARREGDAVVYLEKIGARDLEVPHSRLGGRGLLHATGLGKAILAYSPPHVREEYLAGPLPAVTPATLTDPGALRAEFVRIRRDGVAFDVEESLSGLFCVAAPVRDASGQALAAVSVTGATALSQAERFGPVVAATARAIERHLREGDGRAPQS